jgi:hypothetical protein
MPSGSADSNSRAIAGNRLSTIVSAQDEDWPSVHNTRSPDAAADISRNVYHEAHPDRDHRVSVDN